MSRKKRAIERKVNPDPIYGDYVVTKFINALMQNGSKSTAEFLFYNSIKLAKEKSGDDGLKLFKKALENVKPQLEVKSRRVGGANYQVPVEVKPKRKESLAIRWIIEAARKRTEHTFSDRLAIEIIEASNQKGGAMKKREDIHRMAEANKAFSHFRW